MFKAIVTILYMATTSRMSGGGLGASILPARTDGGKMPFNMTWLPEVFFALAFGVALANVTPIWCGALAAGWSYIWMQTGHGAVLHWGNLDEHDPTRKQTLSPVVDWIAQRIGIVSDTDVNYCRLFMAVKGFLIGLPVGGIVLAILWPLGYEIGARLRGKVSFDPHAAAELVSGAGAGVAIVVFLLIAGVL